MRRNAMLWQAICAVLALGALSWFAYVNQAPVPVYGTPTMYADVPVWVVGCVGAVIGILLEFALTRRIWQAQAAALQTAQAQLRRARAKAQSQSAAIAERDARLHELEAHLAGPSEASQSAPEGGEEESLPEEEEDEEAGI